MAILPGSTLGILGGGQLGRMFVTAARTLGYEVIVLDPDPHSPAGSMASEHVEADYEDAQALNYLAEQCEVITTEFENVPAESLRFLSSRRPVHPSADALSISQDRIREKTFVQSLGLTTATFVAIESEQDLALIRDIPYPAILKTATLGYDGKGQYVCESSQQVAEAFDMLKSRCVLEQRIDLDKEISVVLARDQQGQCHCFPVAQNEHAQGILDVCVAPASISEELSQQAQQAAIRIADGLSYCGVLAIEFFVSKAGELLINEIAPRPHNSGHYTLDACYTSQFEQQVRMICGLASGDCNCHTPAAMLNLLGDLWPEQGQPAWDQVLQMDKAFLHLYGKKQPRTGRKMGHINFLAVDVETARQTLEKARTILISDSPSA